MGRDDVTITRYFGKRRTTYGFRFWYRGRLVKRKGFPTRGLAREAGRRERWHLGEVAFEATYGPLRPRLTAWKEVLQKYEETKRLEGKTDLAKDLTRLSWWVAFFERHAVHYLQALTGDLIAKGRAALEVEPYAKKTKRADVEPKVSYRSEQTVVHYLKVLRHLCELAVNRWDPPLLDKDPSKRVPLPSLDRRAPELPDVTGWDQLLAHAQEHEPELHPILLTGLHTGLREGSIMRLTAERFQERPGWLRGHTPSAGAARRRGETTGSQ
jgi:integrase